LAEQHDTIIEAVRHLLRMNELDGYRVHSVQRSRRAGMSAPRLPCLSPFGPSIPAHVAGVRRWVITLEAPPADRFHAYLCEPCADLVLKQEWRTSIERHGE